MSRSLASLVRGTRLSQHRTIEELALASGVAERTISDIERGVSRAPRRRTIEALADGLQLADEDRTVLLALAAARRTDNQAAALVGTAPLQLTDFVGRTEAVGTVAKTLNTQTEKQRTTVVVSGAPGYGKTTVAVEALGRSPARDVDVFAALGGSTGAPRSPLDVLRGLLRQLDGPASFAPQDLDDARERWQEAVHGRRVAVILDDALDEAQVRPVITALGAVPVVVTSRRTLAGLDDVSRVTLEPFNAGESRALLRGIVPERQHDDASLEDLAMLCGHVPLALRIAANRLASRPAWTVHDLIERLRDERQRIRTLAAGDRGVESAFALSYEQLNAVAQRLFRRLSIIDGQTFTPALVASFAGCSAEVANSELDALADLSLVQAMTGGRFRLHDLLRVYAADRLLLAEGPSLATTLRGMLHRWLLRTTAMAGDAFSDGKPPAAGAEFADPAEASRWLRAESSHWVAALRAAALNGKHRTVVDTAESLHWFSDTWPEWGQWHEVFELAVDAARRLEEPRTIARQLGYLAWAQIVERNDAEAAGETAALALAAAEAARDVKEIGWAGFYVQWAAMSRGDHRSALIAAERNVALLADTDHLEVLLNSMRSRALVLAELGDNEDSIRAHLAVLGRAERVDEQGAFSASAAILRMLSRASIARLYLILEDVESSIDWATFAMELARRLGNGSSEAWATTTRAMALQQAGHPEEAARDARAALALLDGSADGLTAAEAAEVLNRSSSTAEPSA